MKYPSFLLLLIYSFACSGHSNLYSVLPSSNDKVTLFNGTENIIYYWAADRVTLAHINYTLARRPDSPDKIEIGKARQLSFGEIAGYQAGKEVVLFFGGF